MKNRGDFPLAFLVAVLVLIAVCCLILQRGDAQSDKWQDTMIVFICRELDESDAAMARIEEAQARLSRDVAWLQGWLYVAVTLERLKGIGLKPKRVED